MLLRSTLPTALAFLTASPALAVEYRWTSGTGQGTVEASIRNRTGSTFRVFCGSGTDERRAGIILEGLARTAPTGKALDVQVVVDGKNYPFSITDGYGPVAARAGRFALEEMAKAMLASRVKRFTVEYPALDKSETFSLGNVGDALRERGSTIVTPCL